MAHKFDPKNWQRLESPERRRTLAPERVLDEIGLQAGQTFIDVGTGTGFFAIPAAERVGSNGRVYAVDTSEEMLGHLADRINGQPLPIQIIHSQETRIPIEDHIADYVFMSAVFHEILPSDREAFLMELKRLVKPGGKVIILDWAPVMERKIGPPLEERLPRDQVEAALRSVEIDLERSEMFGDHFYLVQGSSNPLVESAK